MTRSQSKYNLLVWWFMIYRTSWLFLEEANHWSQNWPSPKQQRLNYLEINLTLQWNLKNSLYNLVYLHISKDSKLDLPIGTVTNAHFCPCKRCYKYTNAILDLVEYNGHLLRDNLPRQSNVQRPTTYSMKNIAIISNLCISKKLSFATFKLICVGSTRSL